MLSHSNTVHVRYSVTGQFYNELLMTIALSILCGGSSVGGETMTHATDFPLYTARHSQHSAVWTVPGFSMQRFCIACATERLENADELGVHVKESAQRVSDTPQRHKRERSLCENHHVAPCKRTTKTTRPPLPLSQFRFQWNWRKRTSLALLWTSP